MFPSVDILIAGGGVVGSSIAYFLSRSPEGPGLRLAVVEPDPTYATSSTALSVGGIRQQFSTRENVLLSSFSAAFVRKLGPAVSFVEAGYLFLATEAGMEVLRRNYALQRELGARVALLDRKDLTTRFSWLTSEDLSGGGLGLAGEGWLDPYSLLQHFREGAMEKGVTFLRDRVIQIRRQGPRVTEVGLASGTTLPVGGVVDAAGPRAREVAEMAGIPDLPVRPRKRFVYRVHCRTPLPPSPLVVDPTGVYFRPEGPDFLCGVSPSPDQDPDTPDLEMEYDLFQQVVWPALAHRVPAFQRLKLGSSWAGHYAVNTEDRNAILGPHPTLTNFFFANGFSGHGLQHSPGVGRGLSEVILHGEYRSIDLTRLGFGRFSRGRLVKERTVV